ncbi:hypothetical protein [Clostridium formicaceticum]|uniref:Uncharacterized protein n=1 Tax=Clostridium formicaceticum TaxID=1497 RepID=A0AAC9WGZ1_9CLOT|nr:hypothetical protein [Clostridium formicaceticum]AOY77921.1 hypothetical protein BJL90_19890 [Clostridium formicaceticum]ARE88542.1 hypothetical protein CLFO_29480 [Clostridium formicaceticum]
MRQITTSEMLDLTSLLSMETVSLADAKAVRELVQDTELKNLLDSFIQISEGKIKSIQQFINENNIIEGVH